MITYVWIGAALLVIAAYLCYELGPFAALRRWRRIEGGAKLRMCAVPLFATADEERAWELLHVLDLGQRAVLAKVRLEDVVRAVAAGESNEGIWMLERFGGRRLDFVVLDHDWLPVLVVEFAGPQHRVDRLMREHIADALLRSAGVQYLHLRRGEDWAARLLAARGCNKDAAQPVGLDDVRRLANP